MKGKEHIQPEQLASGLKTKPEAKTDSYRLKDVTSFETSEEGLRKKSDQATD